MLAEYLQDLISTVGDLFNKLIRGGCVFGITAVFISYQLTYCSFNPGGKYWV